MISNVYRIEEGEFSSQIGKFSASQKKSRWRGLIVSKHIDVIVDQRENDTVAIAS